MKTNEELNALKEEVKNLNEKLSVLTEEEPEQVTGGAIRREPKIKKLTVLNVIPPHIL